MWATCRSAREYTASRPRRSTPTSLAPRSTRRCCDTSGWLIPSRSTSSWTNRGCSASSATIARRAGAASTLSSSPAASNVFVCADTSLYKHMPMCLCKWHAGMGRARCAALAVPRSLCRARCAALAVPHTTAPSCNETHSQTMFHVMSFATPRPALAGALVALALAAAGCSGGGNSAADASSSTALINAVGAENEYANVLGQIGGRYVHVSSILDNPNTDPHTFEASPQVAQEVSSAD